MLCHLKLNIFRTAVRIFTHLDESLLFSEFKKVFATANQTISFRYRQ